MALDQIQAVITLLSYAVQEASEDIVAPIPQAIRVSSLKNWQCLIKLSQDIVECTSGEPSEKTLKSRKLPGRSRHSLLRVCELFVCVPKCSFPLRFFLCQHLSIPKIMGMLSCLGYSTVVLV